MYTAELNRPFRAKADQIQSGLKLMWTNTV